ncbi:hypothetical protein IU454_08110 [Nocardia farcinica]|uniref:hypothetical protein n=1 Tax=Nocardia farcinica TaxID=37329 RepID=UPI001895CC7D|nr:hypothetical protein [Nocardia farcinica]MBF6291827.1 hypothetical protein [Nocardia farcinica]MBF6315009.1 hypothetical protein [Nocardia farcinica]
MRIRSTKPEFWRSERIAALSWDSRLVLKGLESYVDDNGVGKDDVALIVADVFPRDMLANPRETVARVSEAVSELHRHGFIHRYEVDGTRLLYISWWEAVQRIDKPGKGRFPRPDGTMDYRESVIRESVASPREGVAPGTGEQGNRGTDIRPPVFDVTHDRAGARASGGVVALRAPRGGAQVAARLNATARSAPAHAIAVAFSEALSVPLEAGVLAKVGVEIDSCLAAGIPPPAIAAGLKAWTESDSWSPTQIPAFVHKAANARGRRGRSKPTEKAVDAHAAAEELLREVRTLGDRSE